MADRKECDSCKKLAKPGSLQSWLTVQRLVPLTGRYPVSDATVPTVEVCGVDCLKVEVDKAHAELTVQLLRHELLERLEGAIGTDDFEPALEQYLTLMRTRGAEEHDIAERAERYRKRDTEVVAITTPKESTR